MAMVKMRVELVMRGKRGTGMALHFTFLPAGSGNRNQARRLAEHIRRRKDLKPHLIRVHCGTSKVIAHLRPSFGLVGYFLSFGREVAADEYGQLPLFLEASKEKS